MTTYWKATRPDGTDFYSGTVDYGAALTTGKRVRVTTPARAEYACCTTDVLHASDVPTETLTSLGGSWPCRLFEVTGRPVVQRGREFGFRSLAVVREVEGWRALGPQGAEVAALVDRARLLTGDELSRLAAARDAAARYAARDAAWYAARDAADALISRDLIGDTFTAAHYDSLTGPWATAIGPAHPDDAAVTHA